MHTTTVLVSRGETAPVFICSHATTWLFCLLPGYFVSRNGLFLLTNRGEQRQCRPLSSVFSYHGCVPFFPENSDPLSQLPLIFPEIKLYPAGRGVEYDRVETTRRPAIV